MRASGPPRIALKTATSQSLAWSSRKSALTQIHWMRLTAPASLSAMELQDVFAPDKQAK